MERRRETEAQPKNNPAELRKIMGLTRKEEAEEAAKNAKQGEGYLEAARKGLEKVGDREGKKLADDAVDAVRKVRRHIRKRQERDEEGRKA